jgi:ABC-type transporter Mla subunit MlaD
MALQDLTPQLRTRLSRVERGVGIFVILATLLLLAGFFFYIHTTATRKGWFLIKAPFYTYVETAAGLKVGDPVKLMGFESGAIVAIKPMPPGSEDNVYVEFVVQGDSIGYVWNDSRVRVNAGDLLGGRYLEVLPGGWDGFTNKLTGEFKNLKAAYQLKGKTISTMWHDQAGAYTNWSLGKTPYFLPAIEAMAVTQRAEQLLSQAEAALPNILNLTNQISAVLTNAARAASSLDQFISSVKPAVSDVNDLLAKLRPVASNLNTITTQLREPKGALGEWLIPTNLNWQLQQTLMAATSTLATANSTISNTDANLTLVVSNLNRTLDNLALITSNLNAQVQANTNILSEVSATVIHTDEMVQGLKKHWLLRSSFKTNAPPTKTTAPKPVKK